MVWFILEKYADKCRFLLVALILSPNPWYGTQILNIDRIFKLEISKLMYTLNFRLVPKQFIELFTKIEDIHSYHTRQRSSIEYAIPRTRLKIAQKLFPYTGIGIWSSIDPTIRLILKYHLFVTKFKYKIQEEQWYHHWKSAKQIYDYFQNTANK